MSGFRRSVALLVLNLHSGASAQVRSEDECSRMHPEIESPVEYAKCTSDSENAERAMREAYSELRSKVSGEYRVLLDKAQSTWIANRDAQCAFEAGGYPGNTGWSSAVVDCVASANRKRTEYLKDDLKHRSD